MAKRSTPEDPMQEAQGSDAAMPPPATAECEPMTFRRAFRLFRADLTRRSQLREEPMTAWNVLRALMLPGVIGVGLLRFGNWLHARGWRIACRLVERVLFIVEHGELQIGSHIGPGLVLPDEGTVNIANRARIGANATFYAQASIIISGPPSGRHDFGLGDHCVIGRRVKIFGEISLADGTQVKDNSAVMTSIAAAGSIVWGIPARRRAQVPVELVRRWNTLKARPLASTVEEETP